MIVRDRIDCITLLDACLCLLDSLHAQLDVIDQHMKGSKCCNIQVSPASPTPAIKTT
jgi:hypothetical protein